MGAMNELFPIALTNYFESRIPQPTEPTQSQGPFPETKEKQKDANVL